MTVLSGALAGLEAGLSDISALQIAMIAAVAFGSAVMSGMAGYGIGLILPLVLVPLVGPQPVVPIVAMAGLFMNVSRLAAFFRHADIKRSVAVAAIAAPTCALGAYGFTFLSGNGISLLIGAMLILSVPLRYLLKHLQMQLSERGLLAGSFLYGTIFGVTPGAGVIMVSMLMATGVHGAAVIATDSLISIVLVAVKISVFFVTGVVTPTVVALAFVIGLAVLPSGFAARMIVTRLPVHLHTAMLDVMVMLGGVVLVYYGLR